MHRIDVDCRRTDRTHPMFAPDEDHASSTEFLHQSGAQAVSNKHVERLGNILLTYNFFEKELGEKMFLSELFWVKSRLTKVMKAMFRECQTSVPLSMLLCVGTRR